MRVLAIALALVATAGVAHADDDDEDEDGEFVGVPKFSVGLLIGGHGTRLEGKSETGFGSSLELAVGSQRWQYFIEAGLATSNISPPVTNTDSMVTGRMVNGGLGARWIARQFRPDSYGGVELYLLSRAGMQRFYLDDDTRTSRPELDFGFGLQGRIYKKPRLAFRLDMRVLFTPNESPGFSSGMGVAW